MKIRLIFSILVLIISFSKGTAQNLKEIFKQNDSIEPICNEINKIGILDKYLYSEKEDSSYNLNLYKRLLDNCCDYELYNLTKYGSAMVKIYSYFGLNERNKVLLMAAIRKNIKDTSKVNYFIGPYYDEICGSKIQVNQLVIWLTYWGFYSQPSVTLNEKDWKYIQKKYWKVIEDWGKDIEYSATIEGKAFNDPQGAIIKLKNGNYYFIENKFRWENEIYGKEIRITGKVKLSKLKSNIIIKIWYHKYYYREYPPEYEIIAPQGSWVEFHKKIEISKIEIIDSK